MMELLSPAGGLDSLIAAVQTGADETPSSSVGSRRKKKGSR